MKLSIPSILRKRFAPAFGLIALGLLPVAHAASEPAYTFKRGVNISHWLSQNSGNMTYAAPWFGEGDVDWIAKQGFDLSLIHI